MVSVGIVDYGMGNLKSVYNAFKFIGVEPIVLSTPKGMNDVTHLVIPGVGAYTKAMENIRKLSFEESIQDYVKSGRPVLGICLGMQLLSTLGFEPEETKGFDIIQGSVLKFQSPPVKIVPHMGWNSISLKREHYLFEGVKKTADFFFIHSYHFVTLNQEDVLATTYYDIEFNSIVVKENVFGIQFHPEKSQKQGLKILENFSFGQDVKS